VLGISTMKCDAAKLVSRDKIEKAVFILEMCGTKVYKLELQ
jgi:hypothetical protein